ncbi:MAG: hypothetical protein KH188_03780, partial [Prevotella sp.]|nr:hypothetical protein [Prevotella sp.]
GCISLNLSDNSVMRGRVHARRTLKGLVADLRLTSSDVSGGVHAFLIWKNVSSQNILSLDWRGYPTNAKGEPVACEIDGTTESGGHFIGPAVPGGTYGDDFGWYYLWHNPSARKLVLTSIDIEYDDGSKIHISQDELKYIR